MKRMHKKRINSRILPVFGFVVWLLAGPKSAKAAM